MALQISRKARRLQSLLDQAASQLAFGDEAAAAATLRRLAREKDCPPFALEELGLICLRHGEAQDGAAFLRRSLTPGSSAEQHNNLGYALMLAGDSAAEKTFMRALERDARFHPAHNNLALLFQRAGANERALYHFGEAARLAPGNWNYLSNAATLKHLIGDQVGALEDFSAAVAKGGGANPEVLGNLANVQMHLGRLEEAVETCDKALAIKSDLADVHYARGNALKSLQRHEPALAAYERARALRPDDARVSFASADVYNAMGRFDEALGAIEQYLILTLAAAPAHRDELVALGKCLYAFECLPAIYRDGEQLRAARERMEQLVDQLAAHVRTLIAEPDPHSIRLALRSVLMVSLFFVAYQGENDKALVSGYADAVGKLLGPDRGRAPTPLPRGEKIRIGIASEFLRDHNGSKWAYEWLARLPAEKYEFFCYAFHAAEDAFTQKFAGLGTFRRFMFTEESFERIVAEMRADGLHALLLPDIGMTSSSRVLSLHRIAPVQFTAWGHPVTSGSPVMDFYLSGELMEPADGDDHYRETLVRLPNLGLYLTPTDFDGIEPSRFGLPDDRLIYGSVQSLTKYLPQYDHVFPAIAQRVERALFVFYEGVAGYTTAILRERLERAFAARGLDAQHFVTFLPRSGRRDFLSFLKAMDINLDSIGWSGGYTTLQALEVDCPTVTLPTGLMRGRMSLAMLRMIGADDLIAGSTEDFVEKLVRLGLDDAHRRTVSDRIAVNKYRLYDDAAVIAALDQFLQREVARCQA